MKAKNLIKSKYKYVLLHVVSFCPRNSMKYEMLKIHTFAAAYENDFMQVSWMDFSWIYNGKCTVYEMLTLHVSAPVNVFMDSM